jgi:hypothetical protein
LYRADRRATVASVPVRRASTSRDSASCVRI